MSLHSVSLLLVAVLLKAKSLVELGRIKEAARQCKIIIDIVDSALPSGMQDGISEDCKLLEMFHKALELLSKLWIKAGFLAEAVTAYRRALMKPWSLDPKHLACVRKDLAALLLHGGVETSPQPASKVLCSFWQFVCLADYVMQVLPGSQYQTAIKLLKKLSLCSESGNKPRLPSFLLRAKLCSGDPKEAFGGIKFAQRVIALDKTQTQQLFGQAHIFLGVCYGNAARLSISDHERMYFQGESLKYLNHAAQICREDPEIILILGWKMPFKEIWLQPLVAQCHIQPC